MALLFMDGFDANDFALKWTGYQNVSTSTTTRFSTGRSVSISNYFWQLYKNIPATSDLYVGFALYTASGGWAGNYESYISFHTNSGTTPQFRLKLVAPTTLSIVRHDGTTLASSAAGVMRLDAWQYIEVYAKVADSGGRATVRVNGVTVIDFTGDTKHNGTLDTIDMICLGDTYPGFNYGPRVTTLVDDLYICDATGPAPYNTFLGDVRVHTTSPTGAGNSTQFTPSTGANYAAVDEIPYSATDYVSAIPSGTKDTYQMGDLTVTPNTIFGVQSNIIAKKIDAGTATIRPIIRSGGTDYAGTSSALITNDVTYSHVRTDDPNTSTAWTASGVNNLEAGMEIV